MQWRRFVAVGDSFTEGMNDLGPDGVTFRGWADLVAARLAEVARASGAELGYANLAIRGRLFDRIVDEQVEPALAMAPDLISFAGGGNDVLRPSFSAPALFSRFDEVVGRLRASGADVILFRWVDVTTRLPGRRLILPRTQLFNETVAAVGARHGARVVSLWDDREFDNPTLWSDDRLHLNALGHRRVAAHVLRALAVAPDPTWLNAPPPRQSLSWLAARGHDLRWARAHLGPWIQRRIQGTSSGDTVTAKRPTLAPLG